MTRPPGGMPPPTSVELDGSRIELEPLAEAVAKRYFQEFPRTSGVTGTRRCRGNPRHACTRSKLGRARRARLHGLETTWCGWPRSSSARLPAEHLARDVELCADVVSDARVAALLRSAAVAVRAVDACGASVGRGEVRAEPALRCACATRSSARGSGKRVRRAHDERREETVCVSQRRRSARASRTQALLDVRVILAAGGDQERGRRDRARARRGRARGARRRRRARRPARRWPAPGRRPARARPARPPGHEPAAVRARARSPPRGHPRPRVARSRTRRPRAPRRRSGRPAGRARSARARPPGSPSTPSASCACSPPGSGTAVSSLDASSGWSCRWSRLAASGSQRTQMTSSSCSPSQAIASAVATGAAATTRAAPRRRAAYPAAAAARPVASPSPTSTTVRPVRSGIGVVRRRAARSATALSASSRAVASASTSIR